MADSLPEDTLPPSPPPVTNDQATIDDISSSPAGGRPPAADHLAPTCDLGFEVHPSVSVLPVEHLAHYQLLAEIGRGGMGVVFKARHIHLGRVVALKMIQSGLLARAEELQRFYTEEAVAAQLQHPNIVALYEVGNHEGQPYFCMEFVSGSSLAQKAAQGPLPGRKAADYLEKTARAVHYAHTRGILHRDLKPANVLLDEQDQPKVTDFGLAKLLQTDSGQTRTGAILGTPSYMSPEQAAARKDIGPAADVYALGAILYEMLTGNPPFRGETALATLSQVLEQDPVAPRLLNPKVDRELETICLKCLEKEPGRRYSSAEALAQDLRRYLDGEPITARRLGPLGRALKWCRRKPATAALLLVSATALLAGVIAVLLFGVLAQQAAQQERELRQEAQKQRSDALKAQQLAQVRADSLRHFFYHARIQQAREAWDLADVERAEGLLDFWLPHDGLPDLRGWEWYFLKDLCRGKVTLRGDPRQVNALALRFDDQRLATAGFDKTIHLWDLATGKLLATFPGHQGEIRCLAFRPDGKRLASAGNDKDIKVWDADTGKELLSLKGPTELVRAVVFSPDGKRLVSGGEDHSVRVWDAETGKELFTLPGHTGAVSSVAFHPEGKLLATASHDETIRIWDVDARKEVQVLRGHRGPVMSVAFAPDGNTLATGGGTFNQRGEVKLWQLGKDQAIRSHYWSTNRIQSVAFSRDGKLAAGGRDGLIRVWDKSQTSEAMSFRGDPQQIHALIYTSQGNLLSAGRNGTVRVWNSTGGLETRRLHGHKLTKALAFSKNSNSLASSGPSGLPGLPGNVKLWDLVPGSEPLTLTVLDKGLILGLAFGLDDQVLAAACDDGWVRLLDLKAMKERLPLFAASTLGLLSSPLGQGSLLATPALLLGETKKDLHLLEGHSGQVQAIAWSPDGKRLASGGVDSKVLLWEVQRKADGSLFVSTPRVFSGHKEAVLAVAFSPDGTRLASGSADSTIRIWDVASGKSDVLSGHTEGVNAVAFSPNNREVASGSDDTTVRIWDLKTKGVRKLEGSLARVTSLAYDGTGLRLASGGFDKRVRLWDLVTGQEILELKAGPGYLNCVAFSPDGRRLACAGIDPLIRLWEVRGAAGKD
jgi:WD40 repeat protein